MVWKSPIERPDSRQFVSKIQSSVDAIEIERRNDRGEARDQREGRPEEKTHAPFAAEPPAKRVAHSSRPAGAPKIEERHDFEKLRQYESEDGPMGASNRAGLPRGIDECRRRLGQQRLRRQSVHAQIERIRPRRQRRGADPTISRISAARLMHNALHIVLFEGGIAGHDRKAFELSLSDKYPIERVRVLHRQLGDGQRMLFRYGQRQNARFTRPPRHIQGGIARQFHLPNSNLDRDLPCTGS